MGNIIQQARLCLQQCFNPLGHGIEVTHQPRDFIAPSCRSSGSRREISGRQLPGSYAKTNNRFGHVPRKEVTDEPRRDHQDHQSGYRQSARTKEDSRSRRHAQYHGVAMFAVQRSSGIPLYRRRGKNKPVVGNARTARCDPHCPIRRRTARQFVACLIEEVGAQMLGGIEILKVFAQPFGPAIFILVHSIIQHRRAQRLPGGSPGPKRNRHYDRQHHEQRQRHPKRQKNPEKQTLHFRNSDTTCSWLRTGSALSRGLTREA